MHVAAPGRARVQFKFQPAGALVADLGCDPVVVGNGNILFVQMEQGDVNV